MEYYKVDPNYKKEQSFVCPHNDGVMCSVKDCYHCGWNPRVSRYRLNKILRERAKENGQK